MYTKNLGVALISYNRPHYFSQLLESLEGQSYLDNTYFHLFQDGPKTIADTRLVPKSIKLFADSKLPFKRSHIRRRNVSIAINQFEAVEHMVKRYEYLIVIEDDVILSKHFLRLIRVLIEQYGDREDIFGMSLNFLRRCKGRYIENNLNKMVYTNEHWWAECFSAKKWAIVKPYFMEYYRLVKNINYSQRPHARIKSLFRRHGLFIPQTSQDAGKDYALMRAGLKRINSVVNRGKYIGVEGVHFNEVVAQKYRFSEQVPYEFDSDYDIDKFMLLDKLSD